MTQSKATVSTPVTSGASTAAEAAPFQPLGQAQGSENHQQPVEADDNGNAQHAEASAAP